MTVSEIVLLKERMLIAEAANWLFVTEYRGPNQGECVNEFQQRFGRGMLGKAWCAMFVGYCVDEVEETVSVIRQEPKQNPNLKIDPSTRQTWFNCPEGYRLAPMSRDVRPGMLIVWGNQDPKTRKLLWTGHVEIVERINADDTFWTIGGNTGPGKGVERNGDGVYRKLRTRKQVGNMVPLGFIPVWW